MGNFNYITSVDSYKYKDYTIKELDENIKHKFSHVLTIATERMLGNPIKIIFDGDKIFISSLNGNKEVSNDLVKYFNNNFTKSFSKVIMEFNSVPFIIFGDYLKSNSKINYLNKSEEKLIINDIFINDNWVCSDDFYEILKKTNFSYSPILYKGEFNENIIKNLLTKNSIISENKNTEIYSIFIKPIIEDNYEGKNRLMAQVYNKKYKPITMKDIKDKINKKMEEEMNQFLDFHISNEKTVELFRELLNKESIKCEVSNLKLILPRLVDFFINETKIEILNYVSVTKNSYEETISIIKKKLPNKIRKSLNI